MQKLSDSYITICNRRTPHPTLLAPQVKVLHAPDPPEADGVEGMIQVVQPLHSREAVGIAAVVPQHQASRLWASQAPPFCRVDLPQGQKNAQRRACMKMPCGAGVAKDCVGGRKGWQE